MNTPKLLLVDDDPAIRELLVDYLGEHGIRLHAVPDGKAMRAALETNRFDLVLLDVKLPGENGLTLAGSLLAQGVPLIMLTSLGGEVDRVVGLELGADDYVPKPFNPRELLARIRAVLRRTQGAPLPGTGTAPVPAPAPANGATAAEVYHFSHWRLDLGARRLFAADSRTVGLTYGEFNLLAAFVRNPNRVLSRDRLLELTHLEHEDVFDRSVDVLVLRLRRKIEPDPKQPSLLRTERGVGYVFTAEVRRGA